MSSQGQRSVCALRRSAAGHSVLSPSTAWPLRAVPGYSSSLSPAGQGRQPGRAVCRGKGEEGSRSAVTVFVLLPALLVNPARGRRSRSCAGCNSQVQHGPGASPCFSCCFCDNPSLLPCYLWEVALGLFWGWGSARTTPALERLFHSGLTANDDMAFWI